MESKNKTKKTLEELTKDLIESTTDVNMMFLDRITHLEKVVVTLSTGIQALTKVVFQLHDIDPEDYKKS